jgi:hypothetical protein
MIEASPGFCIITATSPAKLAQYPDAIYHAATASGRYETHRRSSWQLCTSPWQRQLPNVQHCCVCGGCWASAALPDAQIMQHIQPLPASTAGMGPAPSAATQAIPSVISPCSRAVCSATAPTLPLTCPLCTPVGVNTGWCSIMQHTARTLQRAPSLACSTRGWCPGQCSLWGCPPSQYALPQCQQYLVQSASPTAALLLDDFLSACCIKCPAQHHLQQPQPQTLTACTSPPTKATEHG